MRTLVPVLLLVGLFIGFGIWSAHYLDLTASQLASIINKAEASAQSANWQDATIQVEEAHAKWDETRHWWAIIIDHAEIDHIEISFSRLNSYIKTKSTADVFAETAELKKLLKHIPEKEVLNLHNLL